MSARNRGQYFEIIDGVNKGKHCIAYYKDQTEETVKAGKMVVMILDHKADGRTLINPKFLKRIGFVD